MSILTDEDLIEMLQIKFLLEDDITPSYFRNRLLERYTFLNSWIDEYDVNRINQLFHSVPFKPRLSKCTNCKKTQSSFDLVCESCYSTCLQLHEGGYDY